MKTKIFSTLIVLIINAFLAFGQSFTVSGPTTVTVPFGYSTVNAQFNFTYSNINGLWFPALITKVDDGQPYPALPINNSYLPAQINIPLGQGTHTILFSLSSYNWNTLLWDLHQQTPRNVTAYFTIEIKNNFPSGSISVDGQDRSSPYYRTSFTGNNVSIGAIEQSYGGYNWIWNTNGTYNSEWSRVPSGGIASPFSYSQSTSYSVLSDDKNTQVIAGLRKITNITFQNNFVGVGNGGTIIVNGTQYNSPTSSFQVVEQNAITAEAYGLPLTNGIEYSFSSWNDGSTSSTRTFYPNANTTYTANFVGKPTNYGEYVSAGAPVGQPIVVYWTDNPNPAVNQFQIWRKVKQNGNIPALIATVGRGVQTYTDEFYIATNGYTNDLVYYDVRAYYSTEGTYSDPSWVAVFGKKEILPSILDDKPIVSLSNELPVEYSISNYPNPFNPSTTINYQLPQDGMVTIKVYDMLGKEIATLVNENKSAGYYNVNFDASKLTSGVYIYTIRANNYVQSKKMLLMK